MAVRTFPGPDSSGVASWLGEILSATALPVRKIGFGDLRAALSSGAEDFWAKPSHVVFLALIYPIAGLVLARVIVGYDVLPLLFPLAAGFALVGPFAAIGLYEISRRREKGIDTSWLHAFAVLRSTSRASLLALGAVLLAVFFLWLALAWLIYALTLGTEMPTSVADFAYDVVATPGGWALILIGNAVGFVLAAFVLTISVVSFPLILDRHVGVARAVRTSIAAVRENPVPMAAWGLIVAVGLVIGMLPLFVGLALVLPILGHATWHLYRRVVV
jgi:uncharacterized membrane protein